MNTETFEFNGKTIDFEINDKNVMVNATQMAAIFGKKINDFLRLETTKAFVKESLKNGNSRYLKVFSQSDLYYSSQQKGTYMHRILALKFAAWLNPAFELWVFATIDNILFGSYEEDEKNLREIARLQTAIANKKQELERHPLQLELEQLCKEEKKQRKLLDLRKKQLISNFKSLFSEEEMGDEK